VREHWTLDPDLRYLNHGSFGAVPLVTQRAQRRLAEAAEANPMRWFRELAGRLATTRDTIGDYLGVAGGDIALVTNASSGITIALRSLSTRPGQRFVMTNPVYGGIRLMLRRVAAERGCEVVVVPVALDADDDEIVSAIAEVVDAETACIVIDQIASSTAKVMPVERVAELGKSRGVAVVVDGAHAPGLVDDPVVGDYWTGNLHKWPCAPRGTAVLYVAPERQPTVVPSVVSWGDPLGFPLSFDLPGTMDATAWLAAPTSLDLMATLGFAERRKDLGVLVEAGAESLAAAVGGVVVDVATPAPTMRLVSLPAGLVTDEPSGLRLAAFLAAHSSAEVSITSWEDRGFLRVSAHLYNTIDDYTATASRFTPLFADPNLRAEVTRAAR
jgi:isopenicillin-N epimerase